MFRRDSAARFDFVWTSIGRGSLKEVSGYRFLSGKRMLRVTPSKEYNSITSSAETEPVQLAKADAKTWWIFKGEVYWEDEGYSAAEVRTLVLADRRKRERRIQRAEALLASENPGTRRDPIPDKTKMFVWKRDGGKCVKCGSRHKLEFDHILPLSMGGSNTERNIQLLCQDCNRSKGGHLF